MRFLGVSRARSAREPVAKNALEGVSSVPQKRSAVMLEARRQLPPKSRSFDAFAKSDIESRWRHVSRG